MNNPATNRTNLKEAKREKSVESIIDAAKCVFVAKGFAGASMSQIAHRAKLTQSLIYHYFPSKEALWKAVKKDALERSGMSADFGGSQAKNFSEFLMTVLKNRLDFYEKNPRVKTIVAWEKLQSSDTSLYGIEENFEGMWHEDLKRLKSEGFILESIDVKLLGILIISAFAGVLDGIPQVFQGGDVKKKQEEYLAMVRQCLQTFSSPTK